jgi:hypothetical protein
MKAEQIKEITEKATEHLVAALQQGHSEALTNYLKAIGRFHRYSLHNVLLIALRKPNASHVAGFRAAYVFDVSQTDGQDLPQIGMVHGDPREYGEGTSFPSMISSSS